METDTRACLNCRQSTKNAKFCSSSCAATVHNRLYPKRPKQGVCAVCKLACTAGYKFCSAACRERDKRAKDDKLIAAWRSGDLAVLPKYTLRTGLLKGPARRAFFQTKGMKCEKCAWTWLRDGELPPLEVSHKDNDFRNMAFTNLELLCPNCHAIHRRLNPSKHGTGRWLNGGDARRTLGGSGDASSLHGD